jgi:hypothetical protein
VSSARLTPLLLSALALDGCHLLFSHGGGNVVDRAPPDGPGAEQRASACDAAGEVAARDGAPVDARGRDTKPTPADARQGEALPQPCGNGSCEASESCASCPADCGACGCGEVTCARPNVLCVGNSKLSPPAGAWQSTAVSFSSKTFNPSQKAIGAIALRLQLCGASLGGVGFTGTNPGNASDRGAFLGVGLGKEPGTRPANGIWMEVTSTANSKIGCAGAGPFTHDQDYRSYLFQTWFGG